MSVRDGIALNPKDICIQLRHDSGALTRVLDQLESRGLVLRQRSAEDRRAIELHLTAVRRGSAARGGAADGGPHQPGVEGLHPRRGRRAAAPAQQADPRLGRVGADHRAEA